MLVAASALAVGVWFLLRSWCGCFRRGPKAKPCPPFPAVTGGDPAARPLRLKELPASADAVIIGAGPSGLAAAAMLGRRGYRVLVLEQHDRVGGGLHTFEEKGFEFDTGLHYVGELAEGKELRMIVDHLTRGEVAFDHLHDCTVRPGVYDQIRFLPGAGTTRPLEIPASTADWLALLRRTFPDEVAAIDAYERDMRAVGDRGLLYQIWRALRPGSLPSRLLFPLLAEPMTRFNQVTAAERIHALTEDRWLRAVLGYMSQGCCGVPPTEIQYGLVCGLHGHYSSGASYPRGGPSAIAAALAREVERNGGRIFVRAAVDRVLVGADRAVTGVRLVKEGATISAPVVLSTVGLHTTVERLLRPPGPRDTRDPLLAAGRQQLIAQLGQLERTSGHIFVFVGIRGEAAELGIPRRNVWQFPQLDIAGGQQSFAADPEAPFGYIAMASPSAKDSTYAARAPGKTTVAILAGDVPWEWFEQWEDTRIHARGEAYEAFKRRFEQRMLEFMYQMYPATKGRVEYVDTGTPLDTNFYLGKTQGESYGIKANVAKAKADVDWVRPAVPHFPDGLFIAGQDLTCDGFAPALISALMACAAIEGPAHWLEVVPMLGGLRNTLRKVVLGQ